MVRSSCERLLYIVGYNCGQKRMQSRFVLTAANRGHLRSQKGQNHVKPMNNNVKKKTKSFSVNFADFLFPRITKITITS